MSASRPRLLAACVAAASVLVYLPSFTHGWVDLDDPLFLLGTTGWRGLGPPAWRWAVTATVGGTWQPLAWLSYGVDWTLWGLDARGYHLQSALWHGVSAAFVFLIARRLLRDDAKAVVVGLLFGLHPLRVESVAWAAERRDVLSAAFALASTWAFLERRRRLSLGLFALSLLSKGMAITLPVVFLLLDRFDRRGKAPFFALSAVFAAIGLLVQHRLRWSWDQHGLAARLAQSAYAYAFYPLKTLWPSKLAAYYELRPPLDPLEPRFLLAGAAVLAAAALAWRFRKLRLPLAAYAVMLAPVSGFFQFGPQLVADRYSYLPTVPLLMAAPAAAAAALPALAWATWRQQAHWKDGEALWRRVLEADPGSAAARLSLGNRRAGEGRLAEAAAEFDAAIAAYPGCAGADDPVYMERSPVCRKARGNRAALRGQMGDLRSSRRELEELHRLAPDDEAIARNLARARALSAGGTSSGRKPR